MYAQPLAAEARAWRKERPVRDKRTRALLAGHREAEAAIIWSLGDDDVPLWAPLFSVSCGDAASFTSIGTGVKR